VTRVRPRRGSLSLLMAISATELQAARGTALAEAALVDTPAEEEFDFLARLAARLCGTEMAGITLLDGQCQYYKSAIGHSGATIPQDESFCQYTVTSASTMVVEDTLADERFRMSPLVIDSPRIRFYAGAPLQTPEGAVLGALCVMSTEPRRLDAESVELLEGLARQVSALVEQRRRDSQLRESERRLNDDERVASVAAWEWDAVTDRSPWTPEMRALLGVGDDVEGSLENFMKLVHPDDRAQVARQVQDTLANGSSLSHRLRVVHPDGQVKTLDSHLEVVIDENEVAVGMRGATVDVTDLVEAKVHSREQAQGLRAAFDTALDPTFVTDDERRFVHVNQAACALLEYTRDELLGLKVEDLVAEPTRDEAVAIWDGFVEHGTQRGEIKLRRAGGSQALAEYSASANFVPGRHLVVLRDVTERREAELEALEARRRLEETQALARVGSWAWDLGSDLQIVSDELLQILGRGSISPEVSYEEFVDYLHPDDRASFLEVVEQSLRSAKPFRQVFRVITESGEVRTIESHGRVQVNSKGAPVRMFGAAQDITEREQAAHELRVQADILEELPVGVVATAPDRRIEQWNHGAEVLFGVTRAEAQGKRIDELGLIPDSSRELRKQMVERLAKGLPWEGEIDSQDATGRVFPTLVTNSPIRDRRDEIVGYIGVIVDLSDQKEAEADARAARIGTITRLALAIEARDPDTGGHIERIGELATMLAKRLGLDAERIEMIRLSSPMHDVGKIGISDQVLLKPGKLAPKEREAMERHARIGHDILAGSHVEMLDMAARIALTHHEKVDGSGYPNGLKGDEIPLEGRIVAVADVFDALTSDRVYRKAFDFEQAIEMMREGRGTHFDPRLLDVLLADLESFRRVSERH
jgi:PAS domain S-box-containing protein